MLHYFVDVPILEIYQRFRRLKNYEHRLAKLLTKVWVPVLDHPVYCVHSFAVCTLSHVHILAAL